MTQIETWSTPGTVPSTSLRKIIFEITGSTGTPEVAEFETYAG